MNYLFYYFKTICSSLIIVHIYIFIKYTDISNITKNVDIIFPLFKKIKKLKQLKLRIIKHTTSVKETKNAKLGKNESVMLIL